MSLTAIVHMVVWHQSSSQANGGSAAATPKSQKNLWRQWQHSLRGCMCERCSHRARIQDGRFQDKRPRFTLLPGVMPEVLPMWSNGR